MKTIAEMLAKHYGNDDGSRIPHDFQVCAVLATSVRRQGSLYRWEFRDGSAIVADLTNGTWDIEGAEPFSWRGK